MPLIGDIHDFTVSPSDGNRLVLVDADKRVVESTDGGTSWALRGEFPGSSPSVVRLDKDDAQKMWIAASDPTPQKEHLWVSTDRGASWVAISGTGRTDGLPDLPVFSFERDPRDGRVLWAGSFTGLYRSGDAGASWQRHGTGLPNVPVPDIAFTSDGTTIFAGTAGRGIWQVSSAAATGVRAEAGPTAPPAVDFTFAPSNPLPGHVVDFTDRSLGEPATWRWDFGDGSQASTLESPEHIYTDPGRYTVKLEVSNNAGRAQLSKQVVVAYADTGTGDILTYLIPVILTSAGQGGTSFSTELTLTNRSGQDLNLTFHTTGTFNATSTFSLPPGQRIDPDVFTFLKDQTGMTVPAGNVVTSLRIEVRGATKLGQFGAQVRVTTPPAADLAAQGISGRFGLAFPALPLGTGAQTTAIVYGLQQTSSPGQAGARSNLACVNAGPSNVPLELKVTYVNGDTGLSHPSTDSFVLAAWQFDQKGQPLATRGITHGYAKITKVTGEDQFVCYGVVNDNLNGDGSFVPMVIADAHASSSDVVVPVIVGTDKFHSELTIANRSQFTLAGTFELIPASGAVPQFGDIEIGAGAQSTIPDIVSALRDLGFDAPPGTVASLHFEFEHSTAGAGKNEPLEGDHVTDDLAYVGVRTYAEKAGGLFGLAYGGVPVGSAADTEAFVYGLQQSNGTRANVAVVHALGGHLEPLVLEVSYFGPQGSELGNDPQCSPCTLLPGQWKQFNSPLAAYGAPHGYARIRRISGSDQFIAYGVLNDNANDDGSYVPMIVP
jgi:PKD repeat protein